MPACIRDSLSLAKCGLTSKPFGEKQQQHSGSAVRISLAEGDNNQLSLAARLSISLSVCPAYTRQGVGQTGNPLCLQPSFALADLFASAQRIAFSFVNFKCEDICSSGTDPCLISSCSSTCEFTLYLWD